MTNYLQVATTIGSRDAALGIAQTLVNSRLAACVQVFGPLTSTYRWQGKVESAEEWMCLAKTSGDLYERVEAAIRQVHSYEVPEIVATPIVAGSPSYLAWLGESMRADDPGKRGGQ